MTSEAHIRRGLWSAIAGAVALLAAGCAERAASPYEAIGPDADGTTVLVQNTGIDPIAIYVQEEPARLATVMPGRARCVNLRIVQDAQRLIAESIGGGETTVSPLFAIRPGEGWVWTVGTSPVDGLSLVPKAQCDSGST